MKVKFVLEIVFSSVLMLISIIAFSVAVSDTSDVSGSVFAIISSVIVFLASSVFIVFMTFNKIKEKKRLN